MTQIEPTRDRPAMEVEAAGGSIGDLIRDALNYAGVTVSLGAASLELYRLSRAARGALDYVEDCAKQVDHLADIAGGLDVDTALTGAHHDAAAVARSLRERAQAVADHAQEMGTRFRSAREAHESEYGPVQHAMAHKPGQVADRTWYSNR